jgi:hypothetical protein
MSMNPSSRQAIEPLSVGNVVSTGLHDVRSRREGLGLQLRDWQSP